MEQEIPMQEYVQKNTIDPKWISNGQCATQYNSCIVTTGLCREISKEGIG